VTAVARSTQTGGDDRWAQLSARAPRLVSTMHAYMDQMAISLRPSSIAALDIALRSLATYLTTNHRVRALRGVSRHHIEGYKTWLAAQPAGPNKTLSAQTIRHRLGMLRVFIERVAEWDWDDAPKACPILASDLPRVNEPLPKFLDDPSAAALMRAAAAAGPLDRLVVEMLARTGLRVGEFCALEANAVVRIGASEWLRVPVGKLRNDRYVPLHPVLVGLLEDWRTSERGTPDSGGDQGQGWLITDGGQPLNRYRIARILSRVARAAGIGHVHPHQLRHALATQAINRGMSLEAIAALLGHRSLRMTLVYARIADRKVADEYFSVTEQVEALYTTNSPTLPATAEGEAMRRLRLEMHRRDLGNGYCTRPPELDCSFETICETCTHFETGPDFVPVLIRQRDHAAERDQDKLTTIYNRLLDTIEAGHHTHR
jgi:site-specific recombinase XerD